MKKIIFISAILFVNLGFTMKKQGQIVFEYKTIFTYTCCSQSASAGTPGTNSWVNVSVTTCQQGPPALVLHAACAHAGAAAKRQLSAIQQKMIHEVTID